MPITSQDKFSPEVFVEAGGYRHPDSVIYEPVVLVSLDKFWIERGVRIDAFCYILAGQGVKLGVRTHLASGVSIGGGGKLETGWCVGLASGVRIVTGSEDPLQGLTGACVPNEFRSVRRGEVTIEDYCILFTNTVVLPNVKIGKGAVVAAGSIVNRSLEPWAVYAGNPIRKIGIRDQEKVETVAQNMLRNYGY